MPRITAACSEDILDDAKHLAMAIGFGPADANTYDSLNWQDADGHLYAVASFEVKDEWIVTATSALERAEWDTDKDINMAAAGRAQAAMIFDPESTQLAAPGKLTAALGDDGVAVLTAMGLTRGYTE